MASVKIILRARCNQDGTHPLMLQIIANRKKSTSNLGYSLKKEQWDAKSQSVKSNYPNAVRLNELLLTRKKEALGKIISEETKSGAVTAYHLNEKIKQKAIATFKPQADDYLDKLKLSGNYNQYTAEKPRIRHFNEFLKNMDIAFQDITPGLLERFQIFLRRFYIGTKKKPMSERTIVNHLATIRSVFANARKNKQITKDISPFGGQDGIKIKFPDSKKVGISIEDVANLEAHTFDDPRHEHARKLWLFSFYFAGMRISDVLRLKWRDFQNDRLCYAMGKNDKVDTLKVPEKAIAILKHFEQYKANENDLVFPELKGIDLTNEFNTERTIAFKTSALDKTLRKYVAPAVGIAGKLTMHVSRHTFGDIAGDTVQIQMLQKLYRHSNISTTIGYQANFTKQAADDALDSVIHRVQKNKIQ